MTTPAPAPVLPEGMGRTLRWRLLLSLLAVLVVAAAAMGASVYWSVLRQTELLFDYQLRQMALSLRDQGSIPPEDAQSPAGGRLDFVVQIWSQDGSAIYVSGRETATPPNRVVLGYADITGGGELWRTYGVIARDRVIQVAQQQKLRHGYAAQVALRSVGPLVLLAPVLALVIAWLVSRSLAPLKRLAAEVRSRDSRSLQPLPAQDLPDEVRPLVESLNALLARLGEALAAQRHFVSDAAHELRSPLTALKLQVQVLRRAPDEAGRDEAARSLTAGVDRATRLVEQLLALARSDAATPDLRSLPLAETVRQAMVDAAPLADARGSSLSLDVEGEPAVRGDAAGLQALARNLVDNAVRYGKPGGRVGVRVDVDGAGRARLQVDDDGPGIPPEDRERVFDRFVRRDAAVGETGSGLGLAIVRQVALRQRAEVVLGESDLGGLRVTVTWP